MKRIALVLVVIVSLVMVVEWTTYQLRQRRLPTWPRPPTQPAFKRRWRHLRTDLGVLNANVAGSIGSGRREINWDGVPDAFSDRTCYRRIFSTSTRHAAWS